MASYTGGIVKETAIRKERKIFFQTYYWISTLRSFGIVRRNSCPTRKKNFLSDIILDFYFKNLERPAYLEGLSKETVVRKERKIFFQTLYWISILRILIGQLRWRDCQEWQPKN
jgi:hypothetical protein